MKKKTMIRTEVMTMLYKYIFFDNMLDTKSETPENPESITLFDNIIANLDEIDGIISDALFDYTIQRLSLIDRSILRIGAYELIYTDTPKEIVIDEALNLTKKYSDLDDEKQHKFNNKVLDNIAKTRNK